MNTQIIYHMTQESEWQLAVERGWYEAPSLASEGFIHCSYKDQVTDTASRYYTGVRGMVLLEIDPGKLESRLVEERSTGDALYPHLYGRLNLGAVLRVADFEPRPDGSFIFPAELD
jgi:uncharacterized protein (DUF952 family)